MLSKDFQGWKQIFYVNSLGGVFFGGGGGWGTKNAQVEISA